VQIGNLTKIGARTAEEVCRSLPAGGLALSPQPGASPGAFLEQLISGAKFNEAVHFLAFALPKREAVWWACLCARSVLGDPAPPPVLAAVEAAEAWVYRPTDETRRNAMARAQAAKFDSPGAWAAVGAFWSGGSIAPPDLPAVPPAPHLTGVAVAGAITLAAVQTEPALADQKRQRYIEFAIDIANGGSGRLETKSPRT
jgi:hypothetical protein